ncbi:MAG: hypothetical protein WBK28_00810 [Minisyncoccia bacterium]
MKPHRGFTLLIAVILASVSLSIGLALLDIAYKQVILASAARQSQVAFYAADTAMECALYNDQIGNAFAYSIPTGTNNITCNGHAIPVTFTSPSSGTRTRTFFVPCSPPAGATTELARVTIYKESNAATGIYVEGYNVCASSDTRRIERGLKVTY